MESGRFNKIIIFLQKTQAENEARSSRPLFLKKNALYEVKASGLQLNFNFFI